MNCNEIRTYFNGRFEKNMDENKQVAFEKHLQLCKSCKSEYAFFVQGLNLIEFQKQSNLSNERSNQIIDVLLKHKKSRVINISPVLQKVAAILIIGLAIFTGIATANILYRTDKLAEDTYLDDFIESTEYTDLVYEKVFYAEDLNGN